MFFWGAKGRQNECFFFVCFSVGETGFGLLNRISGSIVFLLHFSVNILHS